MVRLIDADELKKQIDYRQWDVDDDLPRDEASIRISECYVVAGMVDDMPTVDAVEVIRCKDCAFYLTGYEQTRYCAKDGILKRETYYCAGAVRKEEK